MATPLPLTLSPATMLPRGKSSTCSSIPVKKPVRRIAQQVSESLPVLPHSSTDWNKAVADVKREYLNRRYRPCAVRCCEILENVRESSSIEPAYLIYLHFYAASAQEMQARGSNSSATSRTYLLRQAREHYARASELIKTAETTARAPLRLSTSCPSLHSPTSSVSSQASTISSVSTITAPMSPVSALKSANKHHSNIPKVKKRVTFIDTPVEPMIRPDSPTLGFDDWSGRSSPEIIEAMPLPPSAISAKHLSVPFNPHKPQLKLDVGTDPFLRTRSIHRYCSILTTLQRQITRHLSFIEDDLTADPAPVPGPLDAEIRALDVHARIERLRASGWQRKRFDVERYEALRENALADLR